MMLRASQRLTCLGLAIAVWMFVVVALSSAQTPAPADAKLATIYRDIKFSQMYPASAVKIIQDDLQTEERAVVGLARLASHESADVRGLTAILLAELGDPEGAAPLWRLLRDESEFVRFGAGGAIVRLNTFTPVALELDGLKDERPEVRRFTIATLRALKDKGAETALVDLLRDEDELVRCEAAAALDACGSDTAVASLIEALHDPSVIVRTRAAKTLADFDDPAILPALADGAHDPDWHVRAASVLSLGRIAQRNPETSSVVTQNLIEKLEQDEYALVRDRAADSLASSQDEKAIHALVKAIVSDNRDARFHAARALKSSQAVSAVPLLLEHRDHKNPEVRQKVLEIIGALGGEDEYPAISAGLEDSDATVRLSAVQALRSLQRRTTKSLDLEARLADSNPHVRAATARTLGDMGKKESVHKLIALLRDDNGYVRGAAAEALGRLGDRTAIVPLLAVLSGELTGDAAYDEGLVIGTDQKTLPEIAKIKRTEQKIEVVRALGVLKAAEALDGIITNGLKAEDPSLRAESAVAIGKIGDVRGAEPLVEAVRPYYAATVPRQVLEEGNIIQSGSVPDTVRQMKEHEARVRASVSWALGELADPSTIPTLTRAANDDNSLVRDAALEALAKISEKQEQLARQEEATPPESTPAP